MEPGDYQKDYDGLWWICLPVLTTQGGKICTALPEKHTPSVPGWKVVENDDGTITVTPSINYQGVWHGWLTKGEWISC